MTPYSDEDIGGGDDEMMGGSRERDKEGRVGEEGGGGTRKESLRGRRLDLKMEQ